MKNTIKLFGIIALAAVIGFAMTACKDETGETTLIYKGWIDVRVNSTLVGTWAYVLKITGDTYELTETSVSRWTGNEWDRTPSLRHESTGTVIGKHGSTYTLKPSTTATTFTATVTSNGLVELSGSINSWTLPGQVNPG